MFTPAERERIRASIVDAARADARISGIALTGSAAVDREDGWSDIDLAFGVRDAAALPRVLDDFTQRMTREHGVLDTVDVTTGAWVYRVFLLPSTLQVDLAFAPASEFGARAPTFRLLHGEAAALPPRPAPAAHPLIGYGWLYALHARSAIARGKPWQAEYMISAMRDQTLALASLRHALPHTEGRGMDRLPSEVTMPLEGALVRSLDRAELVRAFAVAVDRLLAETAHSDPALADRLRDALHELTRI